MASLVAMTKPYRIEYCLRMINHRSINIKNRIRHQMQTDAMRKISLVMDMTNSPDLRIVKY